MEDREIYEKVKEAIVEALGVDAEDVQPTSVLFDDLGAESLDLLDIVFRLEKAFGIKIPREELFPAETLMNNPEFVNNGKLTAKGLAELKNKMPHTDISAFAANPELNKLADLFTVRMIVNYVANKLKAA